MMNPLQRFARRLRAPALRAELAPPAPVAADMVTLPPASPSRVESEAVTAELRTWVHALARDVLALRGGLAALAGAIDAARRAEARADAVLSALRELRLDAEAQDLRESARFAFLQRELSSYEEELRSARAIAAETSERAADAFAAYDAAPTLREAMRGLLERVETLERGPAAPEELGALLERVEGLEERLPETELLSARARAEVGALRDALSWTPPSGPTGTAPAEPQTGVAGEADAMDEMLRDAQRSVVVSDEPFGALPVVAPGDTEALRRAANGAKLDAIGVPRSIERSDAPMRRALLSAAHAALADGGRLILGITNGYTPEAWRRFHADPRNTEPWMPDAWRAELLHAGFRTTRYYDPVSRSYLDDAGDGCGRVFVVAYR